MRRRMLYRKPSGGLPEGYAAVEYIQNNAESFLLLPITYSTENKYVITADIQWLPYANTDNYWSGWNAGGCFGVIRRTSQWSDGVNLTQVESVEKRAALTMTVNRGSDTGTDTVFKIGDRIFSMTRQHPALPEYAVLSPQYPIFKMVNKTGYHVFTGRLFGFKMEVNDILKHDLIPAQRKSDGEYGMYDVATKNFFTNVGDGKFTGA